MLISENIEEGKVEISDIIKAKEVKRENNEVTFELEFKLTKPGNFKYGIRIFPTHPNLPHRQDFSYFKWI